MVDRDTMMELCVREAPEPQCGEVRMDGYGACVLDVGHTGPHAYETFFQTKNPEPASNGMVLHCATCKSPLTKKVSSTNTGYWCDTCCYPPSMSNTYLARPTPKLKKKKNNFDPEPNPFEVDDRRTMFWTFDAD